MKVILRKFAKDHCFGNLWTQNYVDCISFSCTGSLHYGSQSSQIIWESFILKFSKNVIKTSSLRKGSYKSCLSCSSVYLSVYLAICDAFFWGSTQWVFLIFAWGCFDIYTKNWQSWILENFVSCLDN